MRLIEPASKLRLIELLHHYFDIKYTQRIYRNIPKLTYYKTEIEQCAYKVAQEKFNEPFYFVLYDVNLVTACSCRDYFQLRNVKRWSFIQVNCAMIALT